MSSRAVTLVAVIALAAGASAPARTQARGFVVTGAQVADGTGAPLRAAAVRVEGDRITEVGALTPQPGETVVDGTGLVLAPGFIDAHNHSTEGLEQDRDAVTQVSQGITTLAIGQDGSSPWPITDYLDRLRANPPAVNVVMLAGHATIRRQVMGDDYKRRARPAEVAKMRALVDRAMSEGAFGLSSGLEYEVGSYSDIEEVVEMARAAGARGGFYISHIRDEADLTMDAVREAIAIGERGKLPVQITHIKLGTVGVWGKADEVVALVEAARKRGVDVTADAYPYLAWQSTPRVLVPNKRYDDPASVKKGLDDIGGAKNVQITRWKGYERYVGQRLDQVARAEGLSDVEAYIRFAKDEDAGMIGHAMIESDLETFYRQPWVMVASDGGINNNHPRGAGTFPRVLARYVRERQVLTLPEAIRKMTSMPAARMRLADRGAITAGMKADLVLFDPATVADTSTFEQPRSLSTGITKVWVNGGLVWNGTAAGGARPGRVLAPPH
ncbi:MAG: amidohydrolase family protein [Vicinamibacterales bacterium]